jgi:hypothetical protein
MALGDVDEAQGIGRFLIEWALGKTAFGVEERLDLLVNRYN